MHVAEAGAAGGEPVLLLHGWPQHWWEWRHVIPLLAGDFRVIAPDLRGLGWTDAPPSGYRKEEMAADVARLLDALEIERVNLVGHDWGGFIGFLLAILHPERVRRYLALNIIHPWIRPPPIRGLADLGEGLSDFRRLSYQLPIVTPGVNARVIGRRDFMPRFLKAGAVHRDAWTDEDIEAFRAPLREPARLRASAAIYRTFLTRELVPMLAGRYRSRRLSAPTLLLFGRRDFAMNADRLTGYEPHADDMRLELVEDSAHFIAEEKPDLVATRARELFA
jgi:pimeloyl-ACP methyl ester carboxylesterase